jgi:hypothetical protein
VCFRFRAKKEQEKRRRESVHFLVFFFQFFSYVFLGIWGFSFFFLKKDSGGNRHRTKRAVPPNFVRFWEFCYEGTLFFFGYFVHYELSFLMMFVFGSLL